MLKGGLSWVIMLVLIYLLLKFLEGICTVKYICTFFPLHWTEFPMGKFSPKILYGYTRITDGRDFVIGEHTAYFLSV